jgi:hypothetical protein
MWRLGTRYRQYLETKRTPERRVTPLFDTGMITTIGSQCTDWPCNFAGCNFPIIQLNVGESGACCLGYGSQVSLTCHWPLRICVTARQVCGMKMFWTKESAELKLQWNLGGSSARQSYYLGYCILSFGIMAIYDVSVSRLYKGRIAARAFGFFNSFSGVTVPILSSTIVSSFSLPFGF